MYQHSSCVQLADELKKYGLTLTNYASIREQSVGGFIQVMVASLAVRGRSSQGCHQPFSSTAKLTGSVLVWE